MGLLVSACAMVAPMAAHATSVEKIRNEKVVVTEDSLQPGESENLSPQHATLVVSMSDGVALDKTLRSRWNAAGMKGSASYFPPGSRPLRNFGKIPLHFARIEFLTGGRDEKWGMTGLPPNYRILREDRYARTYEIRIPAGAYEQKHTHHARVVVTLQGAELEHILPDGTKQPSTLKTGEIAWREGATHTGHNMGNTDLWVIAVEPK